MVPISPAGVKPPTPTYHLGFSAESPSEFPTLRHTCLHAPISLNFSSVKTAAPAEGADQHGGAHHQKSVGLATAAAFDGDGRRADAPVSALASTVKLNATRGASSGTVPESTPSVPSERPGGSVPPKFLKV